MIWRRFLLWAILVAIAQSAVIGWMLVDRARKITTGQEVIVRSRFVDPRDLFRGHYVRLNLNVGELPAETTQIDRDFVFGETVYAELQQTDAGHWDAVKLWHAPDQANGPVLAGTINSSPSNGADRFRILFPFDRYFAPKLRAKELENFQAEDQLGVILSLAPDGSAVIKGLTINGELIYDEPLL